MKNKIKEMPMRVWFAIFASVFFVAYTIILAVPIRKTQETLTWFGINRLVLAVPLVFLLLATLKSAKSKKNPRVILMWLLLGTTLFSLMVYVADYLDFFNFNYFRPYGLYRISNEYLGGFEDVCKYLYCIEAVLIVIIPSFGKWPVLMYSVGGCLLYVVAGAYEIAVPSEHGATFDALITLATGICFYLCMGSFALKFNRENRFPFLESLGGKIKNYFTGLFALVLVATFLSAPVTTQAAIKDENFSYNRSENGLTITAYLGDSSEVENLVIPSERNGQPVVAIGREAFANCTALKSIELGNNITQIEKEVFKNTALVANDENYDENGMLIVGSYLLAVKQNSNGVYNIPEGVVLVADDCFMSCTYIDEIVIPKSFKYINENSFKKVKASRIHYSGNQAQWRELTYEMNSMIGSDTDFSVQPEIPKKEAIFLVAISVIYLYVAFSLFAGKTEFDECYKNEEC